MASAAAEEPRSVTVRYWDLDLSRPSAVEILKHRIHRAAESVCGDYSYRELRVTPEFNRCVDAAAVKALAEVNSRTKDAALAEVTPRTK